MQDVELADAAYHPAEQPTQPVIPLALAKKPAGHGTHWLGLDAASAELAEPAGHSRHVAADDAPTTVL
jgi:hypothetical protein